MIEIYEGRIGGGKSYSAVRKIADHLAEGLTACTNIAINWDGLCAYMRSEYGKEPLREQLIDLQGVDVRDFHRVTPMGSAGAPVLVVLDECHLDFNARDWNQTSRELLAFLTQSRKQDTDIIFISQSAENIDKQFRRLVQYVWRFRDLRKYKIPGLGVGWGTMLQVVSFGFHSGEQLLACQYDYDGKTLMGREFLTLDKRVFKAYDTKALLSSFQRSGQRGRIKLAKSATSRGAVVLRVLMMIILIALSVGWWVVKAKKEDSKTAKAAVLETTARHPQALPEPPPEPPLKVSVFSSARSEKRPGLRDIREMEEGAKAEYEIFRERFLSYQVAPPAPSALKTSAGTYRRGEMSNKGFVLQVGERQACVVQPNGRMAWIVAEDEVAPPAPPKNDVLQSGGGTLPPAQS